MKHYTAYSGSKYSYSSAMQVYNEDGIPVHREDYTKKDNVKKEVPVLHTAVK